MVIFGLNLLVPFMVFTLVAAVLAMMKFISNNYVKVPPNKVAVFYGRKQRTLDNRVVGYKVVTGGAKFRVPLLESVTYLDLNVFSIDLTVTGAPNKDGVLVMVRGVANVKVLSDEASLMAACERFLGKSPDEIKDIAYKNLEGHLRSIIGRLTIEEIVSDRTKFNQEVLKEAGEDLKKLGLGVDVLTIQEIDDQYGYIKSLGQKRTAEVKRDADIGRAEAERDATVKTTDAIREGKTRENENLVKVAEAEKIRQVQQAIFEAEVAKEKAKAEQAGPLAQALARRDVVEREVDVEKIRTLKEAEVAIAEADKREKELIAQVIKPAEAEKLAAIARAEGEREAAIRRAEAEKQKKSLEGEGAAAATRATGQAEADIIRATGQAEADITRAKLLAEAEGIEKKAEAYKKLDEAGKLLQVLDAVERILPAGLEKLAPVMAEIAKPLGNVDRISLVDFGGGGTNGGSVNKYAQIVPATLVQFLEGMKALGLDPSQIEKLLRIKSEGQSLTAEVVEKVLHKDEAGEGPKA
ncbi:MAG: flotillin family protein [Nitrospirae bacterium]|nr:flotillin family protein [Nitrospirota bacterium]